jgi:hypothetical protein
MNRLAKILVILICVAPIHAAAQTVTVGPTLDGPTTDFELYGDTYFYWQSLAVPSLSVLPRGFNYVKLRFWFDGSRAGNDYFLSAVSFGNGSFGNGNDGQGLIDQYNLEVHKQLDQDIHGWVQWIVPNPGWTSSQPLWFLFSADWTPSWFDHCEAFPNDSVCQDELASVRLTTTDTYADGIWSCDPDPDLPCREGDLLFEATFHSTPEPATVILLGSGLAGLGMLRARRRHKATRLGHDHWSKSA